MIELEFPLIVSEGTQILQEAEGETVKSYVVPTF